MYTLFIELFQVALGTRDMMSRVPNDAEWGTLLKESQRQAILGIMASGIERLPSMQQPPKEILYQWVGHTIQIERQNALSFNSCVELVNQFDEDGFKCCILKGQANRRYYPQGMRTRRSCGDIDVWIKPKRLLKHPIKSILEYVDKNHQTDGLCWLHCNYRDTNGMPVEVHFRPSFLNDPFRNRRFQKFYSKLEDCIQEECFDGERIPVLKPDVDIVFQMNHIYRHLIDEGVGLRQIVDYFFLLLDWNNHHMKSKEEIIETISWIGMNRFAGALMYVLRQVCGMPEELLLCPVSVKKGEFLLNEIIIAGNFGHEDPRMGKLSSSIGLKRQISQAWRRFKRNLRFITTYPEEVLWEPFARLYHFFWKKLGLWKYE